jgi:hypothetical protein
VLERKRALAEHFALPSLERRDVVDALRFANVLICS